MMIEYHNPEATVGIETIPYELSVAISGGGPLRIGLLANGFPDSEAFLNAIGEALHCVAGNLATLTWNKGNASIPANEQILEDIRERCHGVVAAYGH